MEADRQITLRIKSASHKYAEDVEYNVSTSSTVKQVKELIRANYPFHPEIKEQRLIYAGHILEDEQVFSDFLIPNTDGGEESYVVHLCCTNSFTRREREQINSTNSDTKPSSEGGNGGDEEFVANPWSTPQMQIPGGVPQEILSLHQAYLQQMLAFMTHWNAGYYAPLGAQLPGFHAAPTAGTSIPPPQMYFQQMGPDMMNFPQPPPTAAAAAARPPQQQQQQQQRVPPPRPVVRDDEDAGQADMLDWLYTLSRVALIFSVVYFYSSLTRLFLVLIFTGLVFLLQRRNGQQQQQRPADVQNNNNIPPRAAAAPAGAPAPQQREVERQQPPPPPNQAAENPQANVNPTPAATARTENTEAEAAATPANDGTPAGGERAEREGTTPPPSNPTAGTMPEPPPQPVPRITLWGFLSAFVTSLIPDMAQH